MFKLYVFNPLFAVGAAGVLIACPVGAGQGIRVYDIPKQARPGSAGNAAANPHGAAASDPHAAMALPKVKWTSLPAGWKVNPKPGQMRAASFLVSGADGGEAELAVVPMGGMSGMESQIVNMWRGQVSLPPLEEADIPTHSTDIPMCGASGRLFDMASTNAVLPGNKLARLLVAVFKQPDRTWFFKFAGEDSIISGQRAALLEFLKGVSFEAPEAQLPQGHPPVAGGGAPAGQGMMGSGAMQGGDTIKAGEGPHPAWTVPQGWTAVDHSSFLVAKFRVSGKEEGTKAEINVSTSAGTGGGLLPNVNRWRAQLSLAAIDQAALDKLITPLDLPSGRATLVDFSGSDSENDHNARCVGVMVPLQGATWFYKLSGHESVVSREKEALLNFVRSVKY